MVLDDLVGDRAGGDLAGPADQLGDAEGAFPVGVLLAAERGHRAVGPGVHVRAVVGAVDDDRVLGEPELVEQVEELPDDLVVVDHRVVVGGLPAPGLPDALRLRVRAQVHVRGVHPHEERRLGVVLAADEVQRGGRGLVVDGLHPLLGQRPGVLDALLADASVLGLLGRIVGVGRPRADHAPRQQLVVQRRKVVLVGVVGALGLFFGVEVVEVAEELVEAVRRREIDVAITEVVLAELAGRVAVRLEQLGDRRVLRRQTGRGAGEPDLAHARAVDALPGDERRAPGGAALLAVGVREQHALVGDPVDVRRPVAHQPHAVTAEVRDPDVVAPEDEDVGLAVRHARSFRLEESKAAPRRRPSGPCRRAGRVGIPRPG